MFKSAKETFASENQKGMSAMSMRKKSINRADTNTYAAQLKSVFLKLAKAPQQSWLCQSMDISGVFHGSLGLSLHVYKGSMTNRSCINLYDQYLDIPNSYCCLPNWIKCTLQLIKKL